MPRQFDFQPARSSRSRGVRQSVSRPSSHGWSVRKRKPRSSISSRGNSLLRKRAAVGNFPLVAQRVIGIMVSLLLLMIIGWWAVLSLLPVILPVNRDTHIVLAAPISSERINLYFFALSTVDHSVVAVDIPENIQLSPASASARLSEWGRTAQNLSNTEQRAVLSKALGLPVDEVVWLMPHQLTIDASQLLQLTQDQVKHWWWQIARFSSDNLAQSRHMRWSWWAFMHQTKGDRLTVLAPEDQTAWQKIYPRLTRASGFVSCTVAVVNTTPVRGLANDMSKLLENANFKVIRVGDTAQMQTTSQLLVAEDEPSCLAEAQLVAKLSPLQVTVVSDSVLPRQYRAKIVWLVGEEMTR